MLVTSRQSQGVHQTCHSTLGVHSSSDHSKRKGCAKIIYFGLSTVTIHISPQTRHIYRTTSHANHVICIIQDSKNDWLAESAKMSDVFRSAVLTIAVADSEDHSEGIFRPRTAHCPRPVRFEEFRLPRRVRSWYRLDGRLLKE